jgi:hypothetical protein
MKNINNNQTESIQLWQFLLELLTDRHSADLIRWIGTDGEFEFVQPDTVAKMWGSRKGYSNMTYASLSRALRNYYSTNLLSKVNTRQYMYKFDFDLKEALGYSVQEIIKLTKI